MALAQSIIEYVHDNIGAKTLFSTHYHELTQLEQQCPHLQNRHVRAEEHQGQLIFMHKVMEGPSDKSYGIHVAEIAKLPSPLITRAKELLTALEEDKVMIQPAPVVKEEPKVLGGSGQLSLFEEAKPIVKEVVKVEKKVEIVNPYEDIIEELQSIDLYQLTPMQAMNAMYEIKVKLNNRK